ncbi:unnamed protein product [Parajaminaea phylloscopi]
MSGYRVVLLVFCIALGFVFKPIDAIKSGPGGEGDCITQKADCVIAYLDNMDASQQQVTSVITSWEAGQGRGLGWSVFANSVGTLQGNCQNRPTKVTYNFGAHTVTTEFGLGKGRFDEVHEATLLLVNC